MGCEEDGDQPAFQVHLHLLWQGQDEAFVCRNLELWRQELSCQGCGRCLHLHHHCCSLHQVCREAFEGDEGTVDAERKELISHRLYFVSFSPFLGRKKLTNHDCFRKKKK